MELILSSNLDSSLSVNYALAFKPHGKAWDGENTSRIFNFIGDSFKLNSGTTLMRLRREQSLDTASDDAINDYFRDLNRNPRVFSEQLGIEAKRKVVKLYRLKRTWATKEDWEEIAMRLDFILTSHTGLMVFNSPSLVAPVPPPLNSQTARRILYIKLIPIQDVSGGFPYTFPFSFGDGSTISTSNLFDLYRSILNYNVELREF